MVSPRLTGHACALPEAEQHSALTLPDISAQCVQGIRPTRIALIRRQIFRTQEEEIHYVHTASKGPPVSSPKVSYTSACSVTHQRACMSDSQHLCDFKKGS